MAGEGISLQGRRITALLLTAFLVAQVAWRWQSLAIAPASSTPAAWSEAAVGAYVGYGDLLVPQGQGHVLVRSGQGWVQAKAAWRRHWQGVTVEIYGRGQGAVAVAWEAGATAVLPRYGQGYLLRDQQQNLWSVAPGRVQLLLGGGSGTQGRAAFFEGAKRLRREGTVPSGWQAVWADNPLPVGSSVWYLSNRDGQPGITPPHVFRLAPGADGPIAPLVPLGNLRLLTQTKGVVLAADATGEILGIDAASGLVLRRQGDLLVLAVGEGGQILLERVAPSGRELLVTQDGLATTVPLRLPKGDTALGPAAFAAGGPWLALLVQGKAGTEIAAVRLGAGRASAAAAIIPPPPGTVLTTAATLSVAGDELYVTTRQGGRQETWSRPLVGTSPLALGSRLGHGD